MAYQALELVAQAYAKADLEPEDMEKLMQKQTLSQKKCVGTLTMEEEIKSNVASLVFITKEAHVESHHKVFSQMYC